MSSKTNNYNFLTKCGLFGIGLVLGYKLYCKKIKVFVDESKSMNNLQLDTSNIELNTKEIDEYFSMALSVAYQAGNIIKTYINDKENKSKLALTKLNHTDIVTQIDKKCENIILSKIKSLYPDHKIIAEESCNDPTKHNITNDPTWFIDPIDGTTNFFHGIPMVSICID